MPRFTIHASNFPLSIPHKRLGTVVADTREQAEEAAKALYGRTDIVAQPEGKEIEQRQPVSPS